MPKIGKDRWRAEGYWHVGLTGHGNIQITYRRLGVERSEEMVVDIVSARKIAEAIMHQLEQLTWEEPR